MEKNNRLYIATGIIVFISFCTVLFYNIKYSEQLKELIHKKNLLIENQDAIIKNMAKRDSVINTFLESDSINGRLDYKRIFNLYNSLNDSLSLYNSMINLAKDQYGIKYSIKNVKEDNKDVRIITLMFTKIDSALLLYPHYKDKIRYNKEDDSWTVIFDK